MVTDRMLNNFLLFLYDRHVSSRGDALSNLSDGGAHNLEPTFAKKFPGVIKQVGPDGFIDLTKDIRKELEHRGLVEISSSHTTLTPKGYLEAKRLKRPVIAFAKEHWKFISGISLSFIGAIIAILRLTTC